MNERITKFKEDYAKNESKIASLQAKNKKLAEKITQLECRDYRRSPHKRVYD